MQPLRHFLLASMLLATSTHAAPPAPVAITGATLVNPADGRVVADSVIVLRGERIERAGPAAATRVPAGATVIDARGKWVLPGYVDAHVHFFQSGGLYTRPDGPNLTKFRSYETERALIRANLEDTWKRYLASGVTAVVDVGGPMWNFEVRERAGHTDLAPRVAVAGPLISSEPREILALDDPPIVQASSSAEARALVRAQAARKPDLIKIWYLVADDGDPAPFRPIVRAAIAESHRLGLRVAVHATELETARAAVEEGADVLVHMVDDRPVDEKLIALLLKKGTLVTTTLGVNERYVRMETQDWDFTAEELALGNPDVVGTLFDVWHLPAADLPQRISRGLAEPRDHVEARIQARAAIPAANLARLEQAGVTIAVGTDAGNPGTLPGPTFFRELERMRDAGLTPLQILRAATANGAKVFSPKPAFGTLAPGQLADLVVLDADPLADIRNAARVRAVVKGGRYLETAALLDESPVAVVQRQLNAYNAHHLEAFLATYSATAVLTVPGEAPLEGRDAMRRVYGGFFAHNPGLHCQIVQRTPSGNTVTDHERVTGLADGTTIEGAATYTVESGLITRVAFGPSTISKR